MNRPDARRHTYVNLFGQVAQMQIAQNRKVLQIAQRYHVLDARAGALMHCLHNLYARHPVLVRLIVSHVGARFLSAQHAHTGRYAELIADVRCDPNPFADVALLLALTGPSDGWRNVDG